MSAVAGPIPHPPRAATAERRSPRALAVDPPVLKDAWIVPHAQPLEEFLAELRERVGSDDAHERLLRHGGVHLDRVRLCDFPAPPPEIEAGTSVVAYWFTREPEPLVLPPDCVLLDEAGLVAIDKPAWWTTQGTRASRFASLERALRQALECPRLTPVHRIDRETTGVLLFARDSRAASEAGRQFIARSVAKEYLAVVRDVPELPDAWEIRGLMARVEHPSHSLFTVAVHHDGDASSARGDGSWSHTRFSTLRRGGGAALVSARPITGRTHQIRVHLLASGAPIVGDSLYGPGWQPLDPLPGERMLLHARAIEMTVGGRPRRIEAPVPADFPLTEGAEA